jgi:ABC-type multidrug transport system ATPase subunit
LDFSKSYGAGGKMRVELKNIIKTYGDTLALNIDNISFESGKIYALLGSNGSGKTTLLRILSGLDTDFSGEIMYNSNPKIPKDDIAYLPQKPYIFKMSAIKNICLGANLEIALDAIKRVGIEKFENVQVTSLSDGEARRVAIARTLATRRSLILLDEPMAPIDISSFKLIEDFIKYVSNEYNATVIFSTHSPQQALNIADKAVFLLNGKIAEIGEPNKLFSAPKNPMVKEFFKDWRI